MQKARIDFNSLTNEIEDIRIGETSLIYAKLKPVHAEYWLYKIDYDYELSSSRYVICNFRIECLKDNTDSKFQVGIALRNNPVFSNRYEIKNTDMQDKRRYPRATSISFSIDERRVTNSLDFLYEDVLDGQKIIREEKEGKFIGWEIESEELRKKGGKYEGRWMIHISSINNEPNKVRGQRIYHWYGHYPELPTFEIIDEMYEYGCSILILHMPSFKWIDGSVPIDEKGFKKVIERAHELGIKMMFYIQPLLISQASLKHSELEHTLNDNGKLCWHSLKDTQIVFYKPNTDYDCDELCLRCTEAYDYVKETVLKCYRKYNFDGLYIDFAWPSIAVCTDESHGHGKGIFNFYDYIRMMKELRKEIGNEAILIGHGGSLLVPSDYAEGFDACLTGEGQKEMHPEVIGVQTGTAPTLWTMHRRKERQFRSREAMAGIIREGLTPHLGLGVLGKSILASHDPNHTPHFIALWQMFRAFPMEKSIFHNYLADDFVLIEEPEMVYSMYTANNDSALFIICNTGGPESEKKISLEAHIKIDTKKACIPDKMKSMIMKGTSYENFRIREWENINDGSIYIPEIGIHEFIGIVMYQNELPYETKQLIEHLKGRYKRLSGIYERKIKRLLETDKKTDEYNKLDLKKINADEFMKNRIME